MASTILSDNGVSSGSAGIKTTADSTGTLALQTTTAGGAATTAVTIDTSQNVGIGNSTARAHLDINDGTVNTNGDGLKQVGITGVNVASTTATGLLTIQSNDALAVDVGGSIAFGGRYITASNAAANWAFIAGLKASSGTGDLGGYLQFSTRASSGGAVSERMRITDSGNVVTGATSAAFASNTFKFSITEGVSYTPFGINCNVGGAGSANIAVFARSGTAVGNIAVTGSATAYNTSSDYRLKQDITPMTGALAKVSTLKPVTYKWKLDGSDGEGFIAHELSEICPNAVNGKKDAVDADGNPIYQGIDTSFLVATLTAAIQEQQAIITALTARIETLENKT